MVLDAGLQRFNEASQSEATAWARICLDIPRWADELVSARPYPDRASLLTSARTGSNPLSAVEIEQALARHPRIGEPPGGDDTEAHLARSEQSDVDSSDAAAQKRLTDGNRAYEDKFGRVFLVRAAGRTTSDILTALDRRLLNDEDRELIVVAEELRDIAARRLAGMLDA
ncbi:MAG: 2-oxo-4-hydroxy-4-carboxy-5-ureidoimidazoline decarboxylase [Rhodococcus sp. (in: high G+C Gram-positive bacteria)]|nr:MAG: 2-oxo-4-hydroxy-4-carboxy-5-ureidoimidazoline decarboxylase [Rhodococcus sp. (in: high G+C Gram-positive bacteria)]